MFDPEYHNSYDLHDASAKFGDVPENNDEIERDEFIPLCTTKCPDDFCGYY